MQWTAIHAGCNFSIRASRLGGGAFLGQGDDAMELRVDAFEALDVHLRESHRRHLPCADQLCELSDRLKGQLFEIVRNLDRLRPARSESARAWIVLESRDPRIELKGR